jgi:hypothetical protein
MSFGKPVIGKTAAAGLVGLALLAGVAVAQVPVSGVRAEAAKVLALIDKIQAENVPGTARGPRAAFVSESEFNSYIEYRLAEEKGEILKELRLKLFPGNRIEGKILIDLEGRKIPSWIKSRMNLYFAGTVESLGGRVRVRFDSLFLEEQRIQVPLVDAIISVVAQAEKADPIGLEDWHDLPFGIDALETRAGKLIITY